MAQLVERSLPIPEVSSSNPVIGKIYIEHCFTVNCIEKTKIKKKRPGTAHFFKKNTITSLYHLSLDTFDSQLSLLVVFVSHRKNMQTRKQKNEAKYCSRPSDE